MQILDKRVGGAGAVQDYNAAVRCFCCAYNVQATFVVVADERMRVGESEMLNTELTLVIQLVAWCTWSRTAIQFERVSFRFISRLPRIQHCAYNNINKTALYGLSGETNGVCPSHCL